MSHKTYFSVDVETSGLLAEHTDMLSIGVVHINSGSTFSAHVKQIDDPTVRWDESTKKWWEAQVVARERMVQAAILDSRQAALDLVEWVKSLSGENSPRFVAWPASFDYPFVQHWFAAVGVTNPFHYRTVDIRSMADALYGDATPAWFDHVPKAPRIQHDALDDAWQQAEVFKLILNQSRQIIL